MKLSLISVIKGFSLQRWAIAGVMLVYVGINNVSAQVSEVNSSHEIQLLIDVSGSMKLNDPKNLRIPAAKLLINLLPEGTTAGVWLFAENTTQLVKTGDVDKEWKQHALAKIKQIHSTGLFTNIEDVLNNASQHWFKSGSEAKRNLILLTDGVVDVSKDIMLSAESRDRVMVELIPLLQQANVQVQTVALSENADAELLDKLAFDTNGWSEIAESADQLEKIFLKLFKKSLPIDTVPIKNNLFTVDASIKEFSLLVFKKTGAEATKLIRPDKSIISNTDKNESISWLGENNYDLITVKEPAAGDWQIIAEMDEDNQVMIVTDLKFHVDDLENYISTDDSLKISAYLTDNEQLISRADFLNLVQISAELSSEKSKQSHWQINPDAEKVGLFEKTIQNMPVAGLYTIKLIADGKTFKREVIKTFEVVNSPVKLELEVDQDKKTVILTLIPDDKIIQASMMTAQAVINQGRGAPETIEFSRVDEQWQLEIEHVEGQNKIINFVLMAKTIQGKSISPAIKPVNINDSLFIKAPPKAVEEEEIKNDLEDELVPEEQPMEVQKTRKPEQEAEEINWMKTIIIVLLVNIICLGVGYFIVRMMKKRLAEKKLQLLSRLSE